MDKFINSFLESSFAKWCDINIDAAFVAITAIINSIVDACGGVGEVTDRQIDGICMNVCGLVALAAAGVVLAPLVVFGYAARKLGF